MYVNCVRRMPTVPPVPHVHDRMTNCDVFHKVGRVKEKIDDSMDTMPPGHLTPTEGVGPPSGAKRSISDERGIPWAKTPTAHADGSRIAAVKPSISDEYTHTRITNYAAFCSANYLLLVSFCMYHDRGLQLAVSAVSYLSAQEMSRA
jgi:hypothetical protein